MEGLKLGVPNATPVIGTRYVPWYRKKIVLLLASVATVAALGAIGDVYLKTRSYLYIDNAQVDGSKMTVACRHAGKVAKLFAAEGSKVTKGELLVILGDSELVAQKVQAAASVACSEQNVKLCVSALDKTEGDFRRAEMQFKSGSIPAEQYEHSKQQREAAVIQKALAFSQVASARAQVNGIETQMKTVELYAPDDGVVAKRWVSEGDEVQAGSPVYTIFNLRNVSVLANVEETRFRNVHLGQNAVVSVDAYPGRDFTGKVVNVGPCAAAVFSQAPSTNSTGEFTKLTQYIPVRIVVDGLGGNELTSGTPLMPGMSVEVRLKVGDRL